MTYMTDEQIIARGRTVALSRGLTARDGEKAAQKLIKQRRKKAERKPKAMAKRARKLALAAGLPLDELRIMTTDDVSPGLQREWLAQRVPTPEPRGQRFVYARGATGGTIALAADDRAVTQYAKRENLPDDMVGRVDPERAALDRSARQTSKKLGIGYIDAAVLLSHELEGLELAQANGVADVPHMDSSRPMPVDPVLGKQADGTWLQSREEAFQRDVRRAGAAGVVDLDRAVWDAHSELGRDLAYETAAQLRQHAVADHEAAGRTMLAQAKAQEAQRQRAETGAKLLQRQQDRQQRAQRAREEQIHGGSQAGTTGDGHSGDVVAW